MPGPILDALAPVRAALVILLAALATVCATSSALAASTLKLVDYHGYQVAVPRGWPVFDLAKDPSVCVRFDRHAVYLGRPAENQRCPAHAAGRTEAILLQPFGGNTADAGAAGAVSLPSGRSGSLLSRAHGVLITATWDRSPAVIRRALRLRSLRVLTPTAGIRSAAPRASARIAAVPASPGGVYTGLGFDACSTPSTSQMSAWGSSPYHAVGVYIGGLNMACAQPNLSPGWISGESAAGWHVIPIYVGRQAPSNSCGCAAIATSSASSEGSAAAVDAVNQAEALGMGPGNPIYFDMEAYARGAVNSPAVLTFLQSWTDQLHEYGYKSGVYSSDYSGISDLVSEWGTGYTEPDAIWIANWNGIKSTSDANVPASDWATHQRLHQYAGGHNETHGRVTLNIDGDYLDAATAAPGSVIGAAAEPAASSPPTIYGSPMEGQTLSEAHASWPGAPISYSYQWEDCNAVGISCVETPGATGPTYTLGAADIGHTIRVIETAGYTGGPAVPAASHATTPVLSLIPLYWLYTARGNIYSCPGTAWYGSPAVGGYRGSSIVGMAATSDGKGYWLVGAAGKVYAYGDAAMLASRRRAHRIKGIVAAPGGGYWLYTARGNVYGSPGTAWYGSATEDGYRGSSIVGMAVTTDGAGYWLVSATGRVFAFGDAVAHPAPGHTHSVMGIVAAPGDGYWLFTSHGNVYGSPGSGWYGSPAGTGFRGRSITGMAATSDGKGYWLVGAAGRVYAYGDALNLEPRTGRRPIAGIAGG